jgi:hypothetical protein
MLRYLVLLVILISAVTDTHASCAWVFWWRHSKLRDTAHPGKAWQVMQAFPTRHACGQEIKAAIAQAREKFEDIDRASLGPSRVTVEIGETKGTAMRIVQGNNVSADSSIVEEFLCLPDTVDPRK